MFFICSNHYSQILRFQRISGLFHIDQFFIFCVNHYPFDFRKRLQLLFLHFPFAYFTLFFPKVSSNIFVFSYSIVVLQFKYKKKQSCSYSLRKRKLFLLKYVFFYPVRFSFHYVYYLNKRLARRSTFTGIYKNILYYVSCV